MSDWPIWLQGLVGLYAAYGVIIVVKLYVDRDTRPTRGDRGAHVVIWSLALLWPPVLLYFLGVKLRRYRQVRKLRRMTRELLDRMEQVRNVPITGPHYDPVLRCERIRLCFDPDCSCRGHERDSHYDPNVRSPEDYWR